MRNKQTTINQNLRDECCDLPGERKNLLGIFPEQSVLGGIGEHQHNIDVTRSQLDKVTGVCNVC